MAMLRRSRMFFEPINIKRRASQMRTDARANAAAGYQGFADALFEHAEWIDPTPREKPEPARDRKPQRQSTRTQHNAAPRPVNTPGVPVGSTHAVNHSPVRATPVRSGGYRSQVQQPTRQIGNVPASQGRNSVVGAAL